MTKKIKYTDKDVKLNNLVVTKDLSDGRIKEYNQVFHEINQKFGYTPSSLLEKAKEDEKQYIKDGVIEQKALDDRIVSILQLKYYNYLLEKTFKGKKLAKSTIKLKLVVFRTFLNFYKIELPDMIDIDVDTSRIKEDEVPTWGDVETAINLCKSPRDRALIAFAATTGFRVQDIVNFKIKDLINACEIYFEEDEEHTLDNLLKKDPWDIIPCWEINPQKTSRRSKNITIVFNTPETTDYIFKYLEYRKSMNKKKMNGNETIHDNEALFKTQGNYGKEGHMTTGTVEDHFRELNAKMGGEKSRNDIYAKFVIKNLRTLFKSTCQEALQFININAEKTVQLNVIDLFLGHKEKSAVAYAYETLPKDSHDSYLRKVYEQLVESLSIRDTEVKVFKGEEYKKLEAKLEEKDKELEELKHMMSQTQEQVAETNKVVENFIVKRDRTDIRKTITNYFYNNYRDDIIKKEFDKEGNESIGIKKCTVICELAYESALEDESKFTGTNENLDSLIKRAIAKCSFNPDMILPKYDEIHAKNIQIQDSDATIMYIILDVIGIIGNHEDIWEMVKEDQKTLKDTIIKHIQNSNYDINNITEDDEKTIAEDVIMEYLS